MVPATGGSVARKRPERVRLTPIPALNEPQTLIGVHPMAKLPSGVILWQGNSRIDGAPIVAIMTSETSNEKTGNVAQTWILRKDMAPIEAVQSGEDRSICGDCPLRGLAMNGRAVGRSCYVNLAFAPTQIYKSFLEGRYPVATPELLASMVAGRPVRLGAYGDPVAVPRRVWRNLLRHGNGHTGYTHQWRTPMARRYRDLLMASVESEAGAIDAVSKGWRYFRVRRATDVILPGEIMCPASDEAGKRRDCASCRACDGRTRPGQVSVVIIGHGSKPMMSNVQKALNAAASVN
jgi:hypothetical protein